MAAALDESDLSDRSREQLRALFDTASAHLVNTGDRPNATAISEEFAPRWKCQQLLDDAIEAFRGGRAEQTLALAEDPELRELFRRNRSLYANLLGELLRGHQALVQTYVLKTLEADPDLSRQRYGGKTLLHTAAAAV